MNRYQVQTKSEKNRSDVLGKLCDAQVGAEIEIRYGPQQRRDARQPGRLTKFVAPYTDTLQVKRSEFDPGIHSPVRRLTGVLLGSGQEVQVAAYAEYKAVLLTVP